MDDIFVIEADVDPVVPGEVWKDIDGWPFHQVSNQGRVRVLPGGKVRKRIVAQIEIRKQSCDAQGRMVVSQKGVQHKIHHLVLNAFDRPCPPGQECRHLNGNPADNRYPENLKWGTHEENMRDKIRHGTNLNGESNHRSKLTQSQVDYIIAQESYWGVNARLEKFGVSESAIRFIRQGSRWGNNNGVEQ